MFLFVVKELHIEIAKSRNSIEDNILCHRKIFGSLSQSNWTIQKVKWQCCQRLSQRFQLAVKFKYRSVLGGVDGPRLCKWFADLIFDFQLLRFLSLFLFNFSYNPIFFDPNIVVVRGRAWIAEIAGQAGTSHLTAFQFSSYFTCYLAFLPFSFRTKGRLHEKKINKIEFCPNEGEGLPKRAG